MDEILAAFGEIVRRTTQEYGPMVGLVVLLFLFYNGVIFWLVRTLLKAKDSEIERIVDERNSLQGHVLKKRLSSLEPRIDKNLISGEGEK